MKRSATIVAFDIRRALVLLTLLGRTSCLAATPRMSTQPSGMLVPDGAWCWFQDPRAVRHGDKTFLSYVTSKGDIGVSAYDHGSHAVAHAVLHARLEKDDHDAGTIHVLPDGSLMVFYSKHNDREGLRYRLSKAPGDITEWGPERIVRVTGPTRRGACYSHPITLRAEKGRLYLFWRDTDRMPAFSWSDDQAETWVPARKYIRNPEFRYPYVKLASNGERRIHVLMTVTHPKFAPNNVHYMYYEKGAFHRAGGVRIRSVKDVIDADEPSPIHPSEGDLVYEATPDARGWIWDIAPDAADRPVVLYTAMTADGSRHTYRYARWDGDRWLTHELTGGGPQIGDTRELYYSGGMALDHGDPNVVFLSRRDANDGMWRLERWETDNMGESWSTTVLSAQESGLKHVRPVVPRGRRTGDALQVIWMSGRYTHFTDYSTSLMAWPLPPPGTPGTALE